MASITINGLSDQDIAVLTLCARRRNQCVGGEPDWKSFYEQHNRDAYSQIKQEIGTIIADDPALSAQLLGLLSAKLDAESTANQSEAIDE